MTVTPPPSPGLAVIIVSWNSSRWLPACVHSLREHAAAIDMDLIVVDSGSTDDSVAVAESLGATVIRADNHGFAYANNRGLEAVRQEWVLFLNPDTEVVDGTLSGLVHTAGARSRLGIAGVRQLGADGALEYSIRRDPSPLRWLGEAVGSESMPWRYRSWSGERVIDPRRYESESRIDWASGACLLARTEMLRVLGGMDESFFLYSEEPDLCRRARDAGWDVLYLPVLSVVHYGGNERSDPRLTAQLTHARKLYLRKHGSSADRAFGTIALFVGHLMRCVFSRSRNERACARAGLALLLGLRRPPFAAMTAAAPPKPTVWG